jgi:uncharacterized protein YuzE
LIKHKYDPEADAIYITLQSAQYAYGKDLDDERRIDYSSDKQPIGIELLAVSRGVNLYGLPHEDEIAYILGNYEITAYSQTPSSYVESETGIPNISFGVYFIGSEVEESDKTKPRIKEEVTV